MSKRETAVTAQHREAQAQQEAKIIQAKQSRNSGFTLVELMIVIVIIAVLAGAVVPKLSNYIVSAEVSSATKVLGTMSTPANELICMKGTFATWADVGTTGLFEYSKNDGILNDATDKWTYSSSIDAVNGGILIRAVPANDFGPFSTATDYMELFVPFSDNDVPTVTGTTNFQGYDKGFIDTYL